MKIVEQMGIEQKTGAAFASVAFVLSLITGLISGVSFFVVIVRSIITAPVFFIVGFGIILVLKKYVPEMYEGLSSGREEGALSEKEIDIESPELPEAETRDLYGGEEKADDGGFTEFSQDDFARYKTVEDSGIDSTLDTSSGKMGKHIVVQEQFNSYEPKIMAQAIRTMMSKDND